MSHSEDETTDEQDPWVGRTVSDTFRIDAPIGEGAMGRVYRAEQLSLGKPVALKMLHRHLGGDPRIARRFHREARAASRLSHPNSLQIIDFGEASDGTLFIAMELLEGEDLQAIIDHDAPLAPARVADLLVQALRALDEAHHAGIIHRDLKPENVVVTAGRDGKERVKVCDFGIAKIAEDEGRSTAITKDGYVCGTPEYMAPEQARGEPIDSRVDIYAAGVMLYQLLTGKVPFTADSALGVITKHVMDEPVPPRDVRPEWGIPRDLEAIALTALSKTPGDRFESAGAMADAIDQAVRALGPDAQERLGSEALVARAAADAEAAEHGAPEPTEAIPDGAQGRTWSLGLMAAMCLLVLGAWLWLGPHEHASPAVGPASAPSAARESDVPSASERLRESGRAPGDDTEVASEEVGSAPSPELERADAPSVAGSEPEPAATEGETDHEGGRMPVGGRHARAGGSAARRAVRHQPTTGDVTETENESAHRGPAADAARRPARCDPQLPAGGARPPERPGASARARACLHALGRRRTRHRCLSALPAPRAERTRPDDRRADHRAERRLSPPSRADRGLLRPSARPAGAGGR